MKKLTKNQQIYRKELKRLKRALKRIEKRGYIVSTDVIPKTPKRITRQAIERIKSIKTPEIYKASEYVYTDTGEIVAGVQRRAEERKQAAQKAVRTKATKSAEEYYPTFSIITTIRGELESLMRESKPPMPIENRKNVLIRIFDETVATYEDEARLSEYEEYLRQNENEIASLLGIIQYDSEGEEVNASFVRLARLLNQEPLNTFQAENISAMSEYYNG